MNDKALDNSFYFTIIPSKAGFTDQLFQFSTFYKLGLSLGYIYLHSTFVNEREGSEGIFDFLGFNEYFGQNKLTDSQKVYRLMGVDNRFSTENISLKSKIIRKIRFWVHYLLFFREFNFIDIGIGDRQPGSAIDGSLDSIKDVISKAVSRRGSSSPKKKNIVRFHLCEHGKYFFGKLAPLINREIPYYQDGLNLRSKFLKFRERKPVKSRFADGNIKLLVHIRLGDTALIETPWHSFIPLWSGRSLLPLKEYPDKHSDIFGKVLDVSDYARFLERFNNFFVPDNFSTVIYSDGYKASFREVFGHIRDLDLDTDSQRALKDAELTYEENRFSVFDNMVNSVRRVGENDADLQELIQASLLADIIIVGCHQRMIPKFLATYYDTSLRNPPIIIVLHKIKLPGYEEVLGLDASKATVYRVNISDSEYDESLRSVVEQIKLRLDNH